MVPKLYCIETLLKQLGPAAVKDDKLEELQAITDSISTYLLPGEPSLSDIPSNLPKPMRTLPFQHAGLKRPRLLHQHQGRGGLVEALQDENEQLRTHLTALVKEAERADAEMRDMDSTSNFNKGAEFRSSPPFNSKFAPPQPLPPHLYSSSPCPAFPRTVATSQQSQDTQTHPETRENTYLHTLLAFRLSWVLTVFKYYLMAISWHSFG
ncbi:hypothetical protein M422DRAFT_266632 [Sphaerobolus stellatus SS14]|uniref:Uncharacterized protein n=1 Tax=Sphaerobolus stellatus (strain SS14) TaxID=990650 RepID=A0A0C9UR26_SPHS4|nr:hypothetical protein M422DRAFT_266632 [Sphaerobolus stellatus SS14]